MRDSKNWILKKPSTLDDQTSLFENGVGRHRYGMPGLTCGYCQETWTGLRVLDCECPEVCTGIQELNQPISVPLKRFRKIASSVDAALRKKGIEIRAKPGDLFQPVCLRFATPPSKDFLWSTLTCPIVQPWVKEIFQKEKISGVRFVEAKIEFLGTGLIDDSMVFEPEDIFDVVPNERRASEFSPLYQMVVLNDGPLRIGTKIVRECPHCGFVELDLEKSEEEISKEKIPPVDVFFLGGTSLIVVNDKVADLLKSKSCSNVELSHFKVV